MGDDRNRAIGAAVSQIEKQFGKGSIMRMGDEPPRKVASISTGALALDLALGVGGV
ncbi:MAG: DNA recombination/repair protein RecA, partial [Actinobacteria bacterium]|nr:DNA recombination/repair protein RecA [Actinomycetota bacterium]